jgi:steroid delta-isomerase-like uncharacterized protein
MREMIMSSEQNKATLRRVFQEAFNGNKLEVIDETYDEDYEFDAPALAGQAVTTGREAFKHRVEAFAAAFGDIFYTVEDMIAEGDLVATKFTFGGLHHGNFAGYPPTNRNVAITGVHFARFVDGRIKKTWAGFANIAEVLGSQK